MSTLYTGNGLNNPLQITIPSDGDAKPAASVNAALEGLMDKITSSQLPAFDAAVDYPLFPRSVARAQNLIAAAPQSASNRAPYTPGWGWEGAWIQTNVGAADYLDVPLLLPHGSVLTLLQIYLKGSNLPGVHAAMPATKPQVRAFRIDETLGIASVTPITSLTTDPETVVANYEAAHVITISGLSVSIDNTIYRYSVRVIGETGANSQTGLELCGILATCTVNLMDSGAS